MQFSIHSDLQILEKKKSKAFLKQKIRKNLRVKGVNQARFFKMQLVKLQCIEANQGPGLTQFFMRESQIAFALG